MSQTIFPPQKYYVHDTIKPQLSYETNIEPLLCQLETYQPTETKDVFKKVQTKFCYIDIRYEAKLRLFYYLHPERKPTGKSIYEGTVIGNSLPILNY